MTDICRSFLLDMRDGRISPYRSSTGFPFSRHENGSKTWKNLFDSPTEASSCFLSLNEKTGKAGFFLCGMGESNSRLQFGKLQFYH